MQYIGFKLCLTLFLITLFWSTNSVKADDEYCYSTDIERTQYENFSTKTSYQFVKGSTTSDHYSVPDCTPVKFWLLSRHGTRLPTGKEIKKLRNLIKLRNNVVKNYGKDKVGPLCKKDLKLIKNWKWDHTMTEDFDQFLTSQGWNDLRQLAKHYKEIFPSLFDKKYSENKIKFMHTLRQRTMASFRAFAEGLYGENAYDKIKLPPIPEREILLKPYKYCPAWSNEDSSIEQNKFIASAIYQEMIGDISERLGFNRTGNDALTKNDISYMWDMCRYNLAWQLDKPSAWCSAFTKSHVKILEYSSDLSYYYEVGFGSPMAKNLPCLLIQNMLEYLVDEDKNLKVVAYFSHSASVNLLLNAMGAFEDAQPLRADNFELMSDRQYRTSYNSPFTANIAAVKYECNNGTKIRFFINEKPLKFNWCAHNGTICDLKEVETKYKHFADANCEETYCNDNNAKRPIEKFTILSRITQDFSQIDDDSIFIYKI